MTDSFYRELPRLTRFSQIFEGQGFRPVPDDWLVACTDVVGSTLAIEAGRYKELNTAGSLAAMAIGNYFEGMGSTRPTACPRNPGHPTPFAPTNRLRWNRAFRATPAGGRTIRAPRTSPSPSS